MGYKKLKMNGQFFLRVRKKKWEHNNNVVHHTILIHSSDSVWSIECDDEKEENFTRIKILSGEHSNIFMWLEPSACTQHIHSVYNKKSI